MENKWGQMTECFFKTGDEISTVNEKQASEEPTRPAIHAVNSRVYFGLACLSGLTLGAGLVLVLGALHVF